MKRIILVGLMCLGMSVFGIDHGLISGFEVGWNIQQSRLTEDSGTSLYENYDNSLYLRLKSGYRVNNLRIIGTYENTLQVLKIDKYNPIQDTYRIDINYTIGFISIGFFHSCNHPVETQEDDRNIYSNSGHRALYLSFYREFN
jgi:hypothetical protein